MGAARVSRYVAGSECRPGDVWRLLEWCVAHGADELTLEVMALAGVVAERADAFEDLLADAELSPALRPVLDGATGPEFPARVRRWRLDRRTLALLREVMPDGPLHPGAIEPDERGWFERLAVYRDGALLLATATPERLARLRVTDAERDELRALGVPLRVAPSDG